MSAAVATVAKRRHGDHGVVPLSKSNRNRLLKDLDARAKNGDVSAAVGLLLIGTVLDANRNLPALHPE